MRRPPRPTPAAADPDPEPHRSHDPRHLAGQAGEALAIDWLRRQGYRIIARNLRTRLGEIDVLARRGRTWVALEVKARRWHPAPERCVTPKQRARLTAALRALAPGLRPRPKHLRVDVLAIRTAGPGTPELRHFAGEPFDP